MANTSSIVSQCMQCFCSGVLTHCHSQRIFAGIRNILCVQPGEPGRRAHQTGGATPGGTPDDDDRVHPLGQLRPGIHAGSQSRVCMQGPRLPAILHLTPGGTQCPPAGPHFEGGGALRMGERQLHLYHILEAFSHTNPQEYAAVWLPLIDLAEACSEQGAGQFLEARAHLQRQLNPDPIQSSSLTGSPNATTGAIDQTMQSLLNHFPGLQQLVQQMVSSSVEGSDGTVGGLSGVLSQVQGMLHLGLTPVRSPTSIPF